MGASEFVWQPDEEIVRASNLRAFLDAHRLADFAELSRRADDDPEWFYGAVIRHHDIRFYRPYERVLDVSEGGPWARWCVGGTTNLAMNCADRQVEAGRGDAPAIIWEGENGETRRWTYAELAGETSKLATGLRGIGLGKGDVIALYMPMVPEVAAAFLAAATIGAIALPLFSGFGEQALASRLNEADAVAVITTDGTRRRGKTVGLKATVDEAAEKVPSLRHVVVLDHLELDAPLVAGRDHDWRALTSGATADTPTEEVDAEDPVMLMFTSGTAGKPKGTVHTHCGAVIKNALDLGLLLDVRAGDRILWMSDMGWLVGPKIVIGGTLLGATLVLAEGTPDYPDVGRMWRLAAEHDVTILGVAPTIARTFMRHDSAVVEAHVLSSLRIVVSTGELWDRDSWLWLFKHVCKEKMPILNYAGGTEIGGAILSGTVLHPLKPCSFGGPVPGTGAAVVDDQGQPASRDTIGELVMVQPSIGLTRGLWKDRARYLETYWSRFPDMWAHGDLASVDDDGLWYLHGRADDTIKVAGKRTGPAEVEQLLLATGLVSEAAAIGVPDPVKGEAIVCACVRGSADLPDDGVAEALSEAVAKGLGAPFRPREICFVDDLPKTRNLKIMRRVIRAAYTGADPGDVSALANPEALKDIAATLEKRSEQKA